MLAAEIQYETLARSLLFAVLLVTPYGVYKVRQVRALRRAREEEVAAASAPAPQQGPRLEDVIEQISELGADPQLASATFTVPAGVQVGGSAAPAALVDSVVCDALRRSGLVTTAEIDTPDGRVIEVRRTDAAQP